MPLAEAVRQAAAPENGADAGGDMASVQRWDPSLPVPMPWNYASGQRA